MDKMERERKREARKAHKISEFAQKSFGLRAKMFNQKRFKEKAAMRKTIAMHQEGSNKHANDDKNNDGTLPAYLLDRDEVSRAKILSNTVKQKRKEKAGKWTVPIPKVCPSAWCASSSSLRRRPSPRDLYVPPTAQVKPIADDEMFKQMKSGKRMKKSWKRMITKVRQCFAWGGICAMVGDCVPHSFAFVFLGR